VIVGVDGSEQALTAARKAAPGVPVSTAIIDTVVIPASYKERIAIARMLYRHRGHAIHYFGLNTAESLSGP
jgi:hypothetical protein